MLVRMEWSNLAKSAWWKSAAGLWTAAAILSALLLLIFFFPVRQSAAAKALAAQTSDKAPTALLTARLDTDTFDKWQIETLYVTVLNRGNDTLTGLHVEVLAPGFEFTQPVANACSFIAGQTGVQVLTPNQTCTVAVPLKALAASGSYTVAVKAGWFQRQPESPLLLLGTVHMDGALGAERWQRFGERLAQTFKDLTFPLLLLLLTTQLGSWQKNREIRQADEDRKRTEQAQVRQLMLTKVRDMAEQYYLKISAAGKGILDARSNLASGKETSTDRMFYNAMLLVWHMHLLKEERGGMFFQNLHAEEIASKAWSILKPTLFAVVGEDQIALAFTLLAKDSSFATFSKSVRFMSAGSAQFAQWYAGDDSVLLGQHGKLDDFVPLIDALQAIFLYETNAPFDEYYGESRPLRYHSDPFRTPPDAVLNESQKKAAALLIELFEPYRQKTRRREVGRIS